MNRKFIFVLLGVIIIASLGFNVYQHKEIRSENNEREETSKYFMREHEVIFSNALASIKDDKADRTNTDILNTLIEEVSKAQMDFLAARYVQESENGGQFEVNNLVVNGYLNQFKAYRRQLKNETISKQNGEVNEQINDLQYIAQWLDKKYQNKDFDVYSDQEFYNEVFPQLKSSVKDYYFKGY
ncbi:hypothetical protein [Paenibacillus sp. YAF4_2]|uniref:hypothetical protein n=1 Tax=Paenibacillus sp. YAF4_2 TaxID=3233085 RepID=UPI003F9821B2